MPSLTEISSDTLLLVKFLKNKGKHINTLKININTQKFLEEVGIKIKENASLVGEKKIYVNGLGRDYEQKQFTSNLCLLWPHQPIPN